MGALTQTAVALVQYVLSKFGPAYRHLWRHRPRAAGVLEPGTVIPQLAHDHKQAAGPL